MLLCWYLTSSLFILCHYICFTVAYKHSLDKCKIEGCRCLGYNVTPSLSGVNTKINCNLENIATVIITPGKGCWKRILENFLCKYLFRGIDFMEQSGRWYACENGSKLESQIMWMKWPMARRRREYDRVCGFAHCVTYPGQILFRAHWTQRPATWPCFS